MNIQDRFKQLKEEIEYRRDTIKKVDYDKLQKHEPKAEQESDTASAPINNKKNIKKYIIIGLITVLIVVAAVVLTKCSSIDPNGGGGGGILNVGGNPNLNPSDSTVPTEDIGPTEPINPVKNKDPKIFIINGERYELGVVLNEMLNDWEIKDLGIIESYNPGWLEVQPGKTKEWTLVNDEDMQFTIMIYNSTEEKVAFEACRVYAVEFDLSNMASINDVILMDGKLRFGATFLDFCKLLGAPDETVPSDEDGYCSYGWSWRPENSNEEFYVFATFNLELDSPTSIRVQYESVKK